MSEIMSDRLKALRKEKGKKQQEAAEEMFMSRTTLSKYENPDTDTDSMPARELMRLANYYECDPRYLTGDISCKDKEVSDIHDDTGLTEGAIEELKSCKEFVDGMKKKGYSFRTAEEEKLRFISFVIEAMNSFQILRHIETGATAQILDDRYSYRELDFEEEKEEIRRAAMIEDMLNDEKWDDIDVTLPNEQNLLFRRAYCENTASAIRGEVLAMLNRLYDEYSELRIEEEYARIKSSEREEY